MGVDSCYPKDADVDFSGAELEDKLRKAAGSRLSLALPPVILPRSCHDGEIYDTGTNRRLSDLRSHTLPYVGFGLMETMVSIETKDKAAMNMKMSSGVWMCRPSL